jgi:hypothetical protein
LMAAALAILPLIGAFDWTAYVSPPIAMLIVTVANMGLRMITTTPVGKST